MEPVVVLLHSDLGEHLLDEVLVGLGTACTEFFTQGDNSDDWKDMKDYGAGGHVGTFGSAKIKGTDTLNDWVGCGDAVDYKGFTVDAGMQVCFEVHATGASKFAVYQLVGKTKGGDTTYSLKKLQDFTLKEAVKGSGDFQGATAFWTFAEAGTYYFSMESTDAKKGGSASYTVTTSVIAAPGSSDALATGDAPGFGGYDADVLADASSFGGLADFDGQTGWQSLLA